MCLIAFSLQDEPERRLVLASNRDEFWSRPTQPLQAWSGPGNSLIYSGRDQSAGGTWVGISANGRVALLTNVRSGAAETAPRSRGELTTRWLAGSGPDFEGWVNATDPRAYGGFNLVLGNMTAQAPWVWLSNRAPADSSYLRNTQPCLLPEGWWGRVLGPGTHTLSNASLNSPWPKSRLLGQAMAQIEEANAQTPNLWQAALLPTLMSLQRFPEDQLPCTGVPWELEHGLSSPFVYLPERGYGTRSTLLVWADSQGAELSEWTHAPEHTAAEAGQAGGWRLEESVYKRISISTWGMPASS